MIAGRYEFEGQQLTISEICLLVPRLSSATIRNYLRAGMKSRTQMLTHDPGRCWRNAGRKRTNWNNAGFKK